MALIVLVAPPQHYPWLFERANVTPSSQFQALEVVDEHWGVQAMAGFDAWTQNAVSLHVACRNPLVIRRLARETFRRVFIECGKKIALCMVRGTNERSLRLVRGLGFREVYRCADYFENGVDLVAFEMRREACRWLRNFADPVSENAVKEAV